MHTWENHLAARHVTRYSDIRQNTHRLKTHLAAPYVTPNSQNLYTHKGIEKWHVACKSMKEKQILRFHFLCDFKCFGGFFNKNLGLLSTWLKRAIFIGFWSSKGPCLCS